MSDYSDTLLGKFISAMPVNRINQAMQSALAVMVDSSTPPKLAESLDYVLFPGGARVRPKLVVAVANACDAHEEELVDAAAASIEMLHCASLIQDDLQCFDAADTRRGRASLHTVFGSAMAILASDALIVGSFDLLARQTSNPSKSLRLIQCLVKHTSSQGGITAGQAWEQEDQIDLDTYHSAKTGSLFQAAVEMGAICASANPGEWTSTGRLIGKAYQIADDLADTVGLESATGKPVGVDSALGRPNIALQVGVQKATEHLHSLIEEVQQTLPDCPNQKSLRKIIRAEAIRFLPKNVGRSAA